MTKTAQVQDQAMTMITTEKKVRPRSSSSVSASFLMRGIDNMTRRSGQRRRDSNQSSLTEDSVSKQVRFNTRQNKIHIVATRKQLEPIRENVWYTKEEMSLMSEAAGVSVYYSDSIQRFTETCASFHKSLVAADKASPSSPQQRQQQSLVMHAPRLMQEGFNHGYRGLELHSEAGAYRHSMKSKVVHKLVKAQRKQSSKSNGIDESQALAKYSSKLTKPSKDWALLLAQLDFAAMQENFDVFEGTELSDALIAEENESSTLLYL
ncbi:hypothetical protein MPSEU_000904400 [Mayamaea pseudoterrestris]|nr:hypothetical protein MPSEU_000904400 [Mayamaea pseudoterrestris]